VSKDMGVGIWKILLCQRKLVEAHDKEIEAI
jgi:hypothetical protein